MHGVFTTVTVEDSEAARAMLRDQVVPMVKASAGFVSAVWLAPVDNHGVSIVVYDTEANARASAPTVGPSPMPGVVFDTVEVREVVASA